MSTSNSDIAHIAGNASPEVKRFVAKPAEIFMNAFPEDIRSPIFGQAIQERLRVTEVSVYAKAEEPKKMEAKVVLELTVAEDMVNGGGNIHGGCSAFLVDICSTLSLRALNLANNTEVVNSVSQSLNIVYHSPAGLGDDLRIVNTTLTLGARAHSARTEIWNATHHRLVASGVHIKMQPSVAKL